MNLPENQFSVKFYIAKVLMVIPYLKKNYKYLSLGAIIGLSVGLVIDIYKSKDDSFDSTIVFTIENTGNQDAGGIGSILGLSVGNESSNLFSTGNFEELVKLNFVYKKALLTPVKLDKYNDLLINLLIQKSNEKEIKDLKHIRFPKTILPNKLTIDQNNILTICSEVTKSLVVFKRENEKSSFRTLKVTTNNDTLSYLISQTILKTFSDIYIKNKTKKSFELVKILGKRVDSLRSALYYTQGKLASFADQNQQIVFQSAKITADRLQMNSAQIQALYNEAIRNYDNYKFSLVKETPLLNIISQTELPIYNEPYRFGSFIMIGFLIGILLTIIILYIVKVYKEVFND